MAKRNKIVICIVIALACVTFCFLPIVASASVPSDVSTVPTVPLLYGGYTYRNSTNMRIVGGYPTVNRTATGTTGSWYMYCLRNNSTITHPQLFGNLHYEDYGFGNNPNAVYYGAVHDNSVSADNVSLNFACMNSENWEFFLDFCDEETGLSFQWADDEYTDVFRFDITVRYRDDNFGSYSSNKTVYYNDFRAMNTDGSFWVSFVELMNYFEVSYVDNYVTNIIITPQGDSNISGSVVYFKLDNASEYITNDSYLTNMLSIAGGNQGYDNGYNVGYDVGFDEGYGVGYPDGYEDGYASGFDDGEMTDGSYQEGFADGSKFEEKGVFAMITDSVGGFLMFEIWEGFTIGTLLMICMSVPLFVWIIKLLAGG